MRPPLLLLALAQWALASPVWMPEFLPPGEELALGAAAAFGGGAASGPARSMRNLTCVSRNTGEQGVCMFAYICMQSNGTHIGTCIDRFYFGSCCRLRPEANDQDNSLETFPSSPTLHSPSPTPSPSPSLDGLLSTFQSVDGNHIEDATTSPSSSSSSTVLTTSPITSRTTQRPPPNSTAPQKPTHSSKPTTSGLKPTTGPSTIATKPSSTSSPPPKPTSTSKPPLGKPTSKPSTLAPQHQTSPRPPTKPAKPTNRPTSPATTKKPLGTTAATRPRPSSTTTTTTTTTPRPRPTATTPRPRPTTTKPTTTTTTTRRPIPTTAKPYFTSAKPGSHKPSSHKPSTVTPSTQYVLVSSTNSSATGSTAAAEGTTSGVGLVTWTILGGSDQPEPTVPTSRPAASTGAATATPAPRPPPSVTWVQVPEITTPPPAGAAAATTTAAPASSAPSKRPSPTAAPPPPGKPPTTAETAGTVKPPPGKPKPTPTPSTGTTTGTSTTASPATTAGSTAGPTAGSTAGPTAGSTTQFPDKPGAATLQEAEHFLNVSDFHQVCGRRFFPESRVVGGERASYGKWPWQISLRQWRTNTYLHKCGAALLNENWAITAAHCVENVPPSDLLLRLGEHDLSSEAEAYGYEERRVQIVASHPQFDPRTFEYDLALLRFYSPVRFRPNIVPVCVPADDRNFVGDTAYVTGWGRLYEDGPLPSVLQEVSVPVLNNSVCERMYRQAGYIEHIPDIFICAGWRKGGFDSCEGDSGGPMVIQRGDKRWLLAGVISWGIGCAEPNQPGVYTRISQFRDWINQILQF